MTSVVLTSWGLLRVAGRAAGAPIRPVTTPQAGPPAQGPSPEQEVDRWLAQAAAERDEGAFEQLVRRHTPALYAGALRTTGSSELAEEVVQDAWLSAWLHLPGFRGQSAVRTWLFRIVTTKALNALRRPRRTVPLAAVAEPITAGTEQQAELRERAHAVRLAIAALPPRQRDAVVLRDLEGLSYEEVAVSLGCSLPTVKSALHRGRRSLAQALEQYRPGEQDAARDPGAQRSDTRQAGRP